MRYQDDNTWDRNLAQALHILRNRTNAATQHSPSQLVLGYPMPLPGHWNVPEYRRQRLQDARPDVQRVYARQLNFQNRYAPPDQQPVVHFNVGDRVLARKLDRVGPIFSAAWTGPHTVVRVVSDVLYEIDRDGGHVVYHLDYLRPAPDDNPDLDDSSEDDDLEDHQDQEDPPSDPDTDSDELPSTSGPAAPPGELRPARTSPSEPRTDEQPESNQSSPIPTPLPTALCPGRTSPSEPRIDDQPETRLPLLTSTIPLQALCPGRTSPSEPRIDDQPETCLPKPILTIPPAVIFPIRTTPSEPRKDERPEIQPFYPDLTTSPVEFQSNSTRDPDPAAPCSQRSDINASEETSVHVPVPEDPESSIAPVVPPIPPIRRRRRARLIIRDVPSSATATRPSHE